MLRTQPTQPTGAFGRNARSASSPRQSGTQRRQRRPQNHCALEVRIAGVLCGHSITAHGQQETSCSADTEGAQAAGPHAVAKADRVATWHL